MESAERPLARGSALLFFGATGAHATGSAIYAWLQPRGFPILSAAFFEHELLGPFLFAISVTTAVAVARRSALAQVGLGAIAGFWLVAAGFGLLTSATHFAVLLALLLVGAVVLLVAARRAFWKARWSLLAGALGGALLGAGFWASALAPPASTHPTGTRPPPVRIPREPPILERDGLHVRVEGRHILVEHGEDRAEILPGFDYESISPGGSLTVLDRRASRMPPWRAGLRDDGLLVLSAESADFNAQAEVALNAPRVRIRTTTTVKRELAIHLGTVVAARLVGPARLMGPARVLDRVWPPESEQEPVQFVAFRGDRLGFFRAAHDEKGPFELLAEGEADDPVIEASGWRIRVLGWAAQSSREVSPTAGWGISQGTIERAGDWFHWAIAATSIGRGWHTVRTAPGTYVFEVVLEH